MSARTYRAVKALILVGLAIFFAHLLFSGKLYFYIAPRFAWLSLVAVVLFIALAQSYDPVGARAGPAGHEGERHHDPDHNRERSRRSPWPLLILATPLLLGVIVPAQPLGTDAVAARGLNDIAFAADAANTLAVVPGARNVLDWAMAMSRDPAPDALNGQEADVIGFVYRDPTFADDQFLVARFVLVCCVADANPVGLVVQWPGATQLALDSWVQVKGTFAQGEPTPVLVARSVTPVQPPAQPYLYP